MMLEDAKSLYIVYSKCLYCKAKIYSEEIVACSRRKGKAKNKVGPVSAKNYYPCA